MDVMFSDILNYINLIYIFMCNIITYIIITTIPKDLSTGWKRLISTIVAIVAGILFIFVWRESKETIICSFFVQYLMYDYVIKTFFKKLGTIDATKEPKTKDESSDDDMLVV